MKNKLVNKQREDQKTKFKKNVHNNPLTQIVYI